MPLAQGAYGLPAAGQGHNDFLHAPHQYPPTRIDQIPPAPQSAVQQPGTATIQGPTQHAAKQIPPSQAGGRIPPGEPTHADRSAHPPGDHSGM